MAILSRWTKMFPRKHRRWKHRRRQHRRQQPGRKIEVLNMYLNTEAWLADRIERLEEARLLAALQTEIASDFGHQVQTLRKEHSGLQVHCVILSAAH